MEPPTRWSRSKSAHKCILYSNKCVQNFIQIGWLRFGSTRANNLFWSRNRERSSLCLAVNNDSLISVAPCGCNFRGAEPFNRMASLNVSNDLSIYTPRYHSIRFIDSSDQDLFRKLCRPMPDARTLPASFAALNINKCNNTRSRPPLWTSGVFQ